MALPDYQKLTRIAGKPFGDGSDGAFSSATIPTLIQESCSGTATTTTLNTTGTTLSDGDIIFLHQTRGTGAGNWEVNQVVSGGGTSTLTLLRALQFTYTDSGASQAMAVVIKQYTDVTISSGTWNMIAWNNNIGGIFPFACNGTFTPTGSAEGDGNGSIASVGGGNSAGGQGVGFDGGVGVNTAGGTQGEGAPGIGVASTAANGNGGGGGNSFGGDGGGGGGNGVAGSNADNANGNGGIGGGVDGNTELTDMLFGGGGGGSRRDSSTNGERSGGGGGGGIIAIFANDIATPTGTVRVNGGTAASAFWDGGGGAGGSIILQVATATLGTTRFQAIGGLALGSRGGNGGDGRIAIHHSGAISGTTNPTFTDVLDASLVESVGGGGALLGIL